MLFAGTAVYAADNPPAPGLLRWKPADPPSYMYNVTDGNWQTYDTLAAQSVTWTFARPVDVTGFILYADSPDAQLHFTDVYGHVTAAAGASTTIPGAPFAVDVSQVKTVRLSSANAAQTVRVYELDVYGALSPIAPTTPYGLTAVGSDGAVQLNWSPSPYATGYKLSRTTYIGGNPVVQSVYGQTGSYRDTSVINGVSYYYTISAFNEFGESPASNPVYAYPYLPAPAAPTNLTAHPVDSLVLLQWNTVAGAVYYDVQRSYSGGSQATVATTVYGYYADADVQPGVAYTYTVRARNASGTSMWSNPATAVPSVPEPDRVLLTLVLSSGSVKEYDLTMAEAAGFADWYEARAAGSGPAAYPFRHNGSSGPFAERTDYITHSSIVTFEWDAYQSK